MPLGVSLGVPLCVPLAVSVGVWLRVPLTVSLGVPLCVLLGVSLAVSLGVPLCVPLTVSLGVPLCELLGVALGVPLGVLLGVSLGVPLGVMLCVGDTLAVGDTVAVALGAHAGHASHLTAKYDPSSTYAPRRAGAGTAPGPAEPIIAMVDGPRTLPFELPTSVRTAPVWGLTERMRKLFVSPTSTLPKPSRATPRGKEKAAPVPTPSNAPARATPATVVTAPVAMVSTRRRLFDVSAKYSAAASGERAMPRGYQSDALAPTPSRKVHEPDPASVVIVPPRERLRRRQLYVSAK